jgi:hypothetical protein
MLYPLAADALTPRHPVRASALPMGNCTSPEALATLARLPSGRLLAPLDLGAYALAATRLEVVGAPYHRNNAGNLAVYRFFLGTPEDAAGIARQWQVGYVALCPDSFTELGDDAAGGLQLVNQLRAGRHPAWLNPVAVAPAGLALYRVEPGLFTRGSSR